MHQRLLITASRLSDEDLLARMKCLAGGSRELTVELIAHLVEVARRGIHRAEGPGKLFGYLTQVLRFSEAAAWNRIQAARAVRRYPMILDLLADGSVNLTTIRLLGPHLTKQNHLLVLAEATGKGKGEVKKIAARLNPQPDVATTIRKLPTPTGFQTATQEAPADASQPMAVVQQADGSLALGHPPSAAAPAAAVSFGASQPESHRPIVEPLSHERYRLQMTMDEQMHDDLRWLQDSLRREIPDGDAAVIVARALQVLRAQVAKKLFAATSQPRATRPAKPGVRDAAAAVQRAVWSRDDGRCVFVARDGRRCDERSYLEYHHVVPFTDGGEATVENIALRCREHNVYEAELLFGRWTERATEIEDLSAQR